MLKYINYVHISTYVKHLSMVLGNSIVGGYTVRGEKRELPSQMSHRQNRQMLGEYRKKIIFWLART